MLKLAPDIWQITLAQLRECGAGRNECVIYWTAPLDQLDVADAAVHPAHSSTPFHYAPHQEWLHQFWAGLVIERRSVVAQIHTHKYEACHSATDDKYPLIHQPGFLSLVIPAFATEPVRIDQLFLAAIDDHGHWRQAHVSERIQGVP